MAVGWIDNLYNNTARPWYLRSVDDRHNGVLVSAGGRLVLDDGRFHEVAAHTHYAADWCGIPWYFQGKHFKVLSRSGQGGARFFTSEVGAENWLVFEDSGTGRGIGRQSVPKGSDFHCNLRIEDNGVFFDVVNNHAFSAENAVSQIYSEAKEWVGMAMPAIAAAISAAA
jgi:hypothetical protein